MASIARGSADSLDVVENAITAGSRTALKELSNRDAEQEHHRQKDALAQNRTSAV